MLPHCYHISTCKGGVGKVMSALNSVDCGNPIGGMSEATVVNKRVS